MGELSEKVFPGVQGQRHCPLELRGESNRSGSTWARDSEVRVGLYGMLGDGMDGNKWFSLADKVWRVSTLQAAFDSLGSHFRAANHWPSERARNNLRTKLRSKLEPNAYFEERGLLSLVKAHETSCESHEVLPIWQGNH